MMKLTVSTSNAAFDGDLLTEELSRILRAVADRIYEGRTEGRILDSNGNAVGTYELRS